MPLANFIVFPTDLTGSPTLYNPIGVPNPGDYAAGGILLAPVRFLGGIYARVSVFTFTATFTLASDEIPVDYSISCLLDAVDSTDTPISTEAGLCNHLGWYGQTTVAAADDAPCAIRFAEAVYVDGDSNFTIMGHDSIPFFLSCMENSDYTSITWGQGSGDNCPISFSLPETGAEFTDPGATITITIASPGVVTYNAHGLSNGDGILFTTTGALPSPLQKQTKYFVVNKTANTFQLALSSGGAGVNTTGTQSGVHTAHRYGSGFDNTGFVGVTLQLGGRIPITGGSYDTITGSGTLHASKYWGYDPSDGNGPIYNVDTGEWIRNPLDPQFSLLT